MSLIIYTSSPAEQVYTLLATFIASEFTFSWGGTKIGKGGPVLAAKIGPGGPVLATD